MNWQPETCGPPKGQHDPKRQSSQHLNNPDSLRGDIEHTRCEMDETLDALMACLKPQHLVNQALRQFTKGKGADAQAVSRAAVSRGVETVKSHPVPSALIGAGLAWLLYDKSSKPKTHAADGPMHSGSYVDARTGQPYREEYGPIDAAAAADELDAHPFPAESVPPKVGLVRGEHSGSFVDARTGESYAEGVGDLYDEDAPGKFARGKARATSVGNRAKDKARSAGQSVREAGKDVSSSIRSAGQKAGHSLQSAGHKAGSSLRSAGHSAKESGRSAGHYVQHGAHQAYEGSERLAGRVKSGARSLGNRAADRASSAAAYTSETASAAAQRTREVSREHPIAMGLGVLTAGLLAGLLIPETRREDRLMGERRDQLRDRARHAGYDTLQRAQTVAGAAADAARNQAADEGLSPRQIKARAQEVWQDVRDTARDDIEEHELTPEAFHEKARHVASAAKEAGQHEAKQQGFSNDGQHSDADADEESSQSDIDRELRADEASDDAQTHLAQRQNTPR